MVSILLAAGCAGTEHAVFELGVQPSVGEPAPSHDAATDEDASVVTVPADEDAGGGPDPGLDPHATFDWHESLPGQGTCKAGRYVGTFTCTLSGVGVSSPPPVFSGSVTFTLAGSPEEQLLSITRGAVAGQLFSAALSGTLDCLAKHFTATTLGDPTTAGQGTGSPLPVFSFDTTLDGAFDDQALVIVGAFAEANAAGQTCQGTFRVSATP